MMGGFPNRPSERPRGPPMLTSRRMPVAPSSRIGNAGNSPGISVTLFAVVGHRPHSAPTRRHLFLHDAAVPHASAPAEGAEASRRLAPVGPVTLAINDDVSAQFLNPLGSKPAPSKLRNMKCKIFQDRPHS
jgi:hypothetical protein